MRAALSCVLFVAGCASPADRSATAAGATPARAAAPTLPPAAASASSASAPASVAPAAPIASAPAPSGPSVRWLSRHLTLGQLPYPARRSLLELVLQGDVATLTRTDEKATRSLSLDQVDHGATWAPDKTTLYRGPRRDERGRLHLALQSQGEPDLDWGCVVKTAVVAAPGALRVKSPGHRECGDQGVWKPPASTKLEVLECRPEIEGKPDPDAPPTVFAAAPGVEYVWVNDDCVMQGGGLRSVTR